MTERTDPWAVIAPPDRAANISTRRADSDGPWDLFWAVDIERACLLFLRFAEERSLSRPVPRIRGLKVEIRRADGEAARLLMLRLLDPEQRELFHRLCLDIVAATEKAETERDAVARFLGRTWRWHRLLARGRDDRLSDEEQKGLLAELEVLKAHLFPAIGAPAAVRAWSGPLGSPKDFEIGRICVEAKARRGAAAPNVEISSEHQLATEGIGALFLQVLDVAVAADDAAPGATITEAVEAVRRRIPANDHETRALFDERLSALGFDPDDDYSDRRWETGDERLFEVGPDFPRIVPSMFPGSVNKVRYRIGLPSCEPFRVEPKILHGRLSGGLHGDDD